MADMIVWPLVSNVVRGRLTNHTFGMVRKYASGAPKPHQGWDLEAHVGEPAYAIAAGKIEFVRDKGDYGLQVCMSFSFDSATLYAFYAHLDKSYVKEGDAVAPNDFIAACGKSGNARNLPKSDEHLHLEIRTRLKPGLGLEHRLDPVKVFGKCPLKLPIPG
jgi:murein DD-endopeptidase MepM/ murein hydrolase activator NlpD